MLTPAAPSFFDTLPSVPGLSVRVTVKTSSSVVSQPIDEQIFLAAAVLSTTMRTAPRPPSVVAMRARIADIDLLGAQGGADLPQTARLIRDPYRQLLSSRHLSHLS